MDESYSKALKARLLYEELTVPKRILNFPIVYDKYLPKYGVLPTEQKTSPYPVAATRNSVFRRYGDLYFRNVSMILTKKSEDDAPSKRVSAAPHLRPWSEARQGRVASPNSYPTASTLIKKNRRYFSTKMPAAITGHNEVRPEAATEARKAKYFNTLRQPSPVTSLVDGLLLSPQFGGTRPAPLQLRFKTAKGTPSHSRKVVEKPPANVFTLRPPDADSPEDGDDKYDSAELRNRLLHQVWPDRGRTKLFLFKQSMPYTVNRYLRSGRYSAGLADTFLQDRLRKYYFSNRTDGFFDLSYPETWREDIDAFSLTNKHVWRHPVMRLKKLSTQKDILGKGTPQQYASRRFSNKASDVLGHSVTSAAPFYLTSRDGKSVEYALGEVLRKSKGALDLKSLAHTTAPEKYNTFGYHNILNMGLGEVTDAYTDTISVD